MLSFIVLLLFLVFGSVSLQVSAPSVATAGQSVDVTWTRNLPIDPSKFTLKFQEASRDVDSKGQKSGQVSFTPMTSGEFKITAVTRGLIPFPIPLLPDSKVTVNNPDPPPQGSATPPTGPPPPQDAGSAGGTGPASQPAPPQPQQTTSSSTQAQTTTSQIASSGVGIKVLSSTSTTASTQTSSGPSSAGSTVATDSLGSSIISSNSSISASTSLTSTPVGYDTTGTTTSIGQPGATTTPGTASPGAAKSNSGIIAGTVIGILMLIAVVALLLCLCRRRRRHDTQLYQDMMVRRRSQAILFSQATTPSVRAATTMEGQYTAFGPDLEMVEEVSEVSQQYPTAPVHGPSHSLDIKDAPWTDRQTHIHSKILDLQGKLIAKQSWSGFSDSFEDYDVDDLKARIRRLEEIMQSAWALGFTDEVPSGYE